MSAYLAANLVWFERMRRRVPRCDRVGLRDLWQDEISPHVKQGVWCVLGIATHSADYIMALRRELTGLVGPDTPISLSRMLVAATGWPTWDR